MSRSTDDSNTESQPQLRRTLSLPWLVLYGLGTTIGAGIYALTGVVAGAAGLHAPACFLLASLIAAFTALSFSELVGRYPRAGGEAVFVHEGFRSAGLTRIVGLLVVIAGLISAATVCVAFVGYLTEFVPAPRILTIVAVVLAVGAVAGWGVRESVVAAGLMTLIEIGGLLAIIGFGAERLVEVPAHISEFLPLRPDDWQAVAAGAVLAFYAFLGFEDLVNVAEETRDVRRVMPLAILATLALTTLLYVLVAVVAVSTVAPDELAKAKAPLALVMERCGGSAGLMGVIALFALLNGALIQVIKAARVLFGLAREGMLPQILARIHPRTRTPLFATVCSTSLVVVLATSLPLATLAKATSNVTLVTFALANLALLRVKARGAAPEGVFSVPAWVPAAGLVLDLGLIGVQLADRVT